MPASSVVTRISYRSPSRRWKNRFCVLSRGLAEVATNVLAVTSNSDKFKWCSVAVRFASLDTERFHKRDANSVTLLVALKE